MAELRQAMNELDGKYDPARARLNKLIADLENRRVREQEAARLLRLAADHGDADAQVSLGVCYELARGVPKDDREAARL